MYYSHLCSCCLDPCKKKRCGIYSNCLSLSDQSAECVCPLCADEVDFKPVCGSNGLTYPSICQLKKKSCESKKMVTVMKASACGMFSK